MYMYIYIYIYIHMERYIHTYGEIIVLGFTCRVLVGHDGMKKHGNKLPHYHWGLYRANVFAVVMLHASAHFVERWLSRSISPFTTDNQQV